MSRLAKRPSHSLWWWRRRIQSYLFVVPAVLLLLVLLAYPLVYIVQISLSKFDTATMSPTNFAGIENYARVVRDYRFWTSLKMTVLYLGGALPLQMVLGVALAFLLAAEWPGVKVVRALFLIPMVVTPVVAGSVWKTLLDPMWGYINHLITILGGQAMHWLTNPRLALLSIVLIDTWRWSPFVILIVLAGIVSLDQEPLEAARVDGASWWQTMTHVKLPMLRPVISSALFIRWLGAIKMFDIIYAATRGGPGNRTEVVNLYIYNKAFRGLGFEQSAAIVVMIVVATLALTLAFVRVSLRKET